MTTQPKGSVCKHSHLYLDGSPHVSTAGFRRPSQSQRAVAVAQNRRVGSTWSAVTSQALFEDSATFPGPLIIPEDDLAEDPEYPPQDFKEWRDDKERNPVTANRKTIYVVPSPVITSEMSKMRDWSKPTSKAARKWWNEASPPKMEDVVEYLSAFYYGMGVKIFDKHFHWQPWDEATIGSRRSKKVKQSYDGSPLKKSEGERLIGLKTPTDELWGIKCRASPDGTSQMQVNLNNVLDALMPNIPADAYSIAMLIDQDMYEGDTEDEIFTAGRAYGGSRIAVISSFRDHPSITPLDEGHGWPSSHCASYVDDLCSQYDVETAKKLKAQATLREAGPLHVAIEAAPSRPRPGRSSSSIPSGETLIVEWLGRIVVTMAHELGHCIGMDHCVYFACSMQGCCSVSEAQRQPPYLCPICLEKLASTIGEGVVDGWKDTTVGKSVRNRFVMERYEALRRVCEKWGDPKGSRMFAGYKAWLDAVIEHSG